MLIISEKNGRDILKKKKKKKKVIVSNNIKERPSTDSIDTHTHMKGNNNIKDQWSTIAQNTPFLTTPVVKQNIPNLQQV